ncbi:MAG TPA: ABC transporter substrate-binding protein [Xanthobacteraceae bacterium]|nr:ABC transporter substrate-binding protein [Xanthobacteraceae bacterium]
MRRLLAAVAASACMMFGSGPGAADDVLKLAVGAPNNWDTCIPEIGQRAGIFKKHGLTLELLYTQGGGETMQAVISGSVDIGIAAGTAAVMGAFAKGAPVRILAAGTTGTSDLYWYVPAGSPISSFKDVNGRTVGYSTNGASTHTTLLALIKHFDVSAQPVASGAAAVTYTQAMSGQIDVGWASPPFGLEALQDGKTRLIARGSDAPSTRDQTVRVHIINANVLVQRRDAIARFMRAYRETYDLLYDNPQGVKLYAPYGKVTEPLAIRIRDEFLPKPAMLPDRISGLDAITQDAITFKILPAPLSRQQLDELIQIPPRVP